MAIRYCRVWWAQIIIIVTAINTVRSELEGKIAERMDYALPAADEQNQGLREEVNQKLRETQQIITYLSQWETALLGKRCINMQQ
jgi:hypothetical protein